MSHKKISETAGNAPEPQIEEWMRRAEDAIVADVRQQNRGLGRPVVWVTDRDRWAKLIAASRVAASSKEAATPARLHFEHVTCKRSIDGGDMTWEMEDASGRPYYKCCQCGERISIPVRAEPAPSPASQEATPPRDWRIGESGVIPVRVVNFDSAGRVMVLPEKVGLAHNDDYIHVKREHLERVDTEPSLATKEIAAHDVTRRPPHYEAQPYVRRMEKGETMTTAVCSRCEAPAEFVNAEGVWRHAQPGVKVEYVKAHVHCCGCSVTVQRAGFAHE